MAYFSVHTPIPKIVVINPTITAIFTYCRISPNQIDSRKFRTRGFFIFLINIRNLRETKVLQLFMVAPVIRHKANHVLGEIVNGRENQQITVEPEQENLIAITIATFS